eukprot:jgi/Psemu1/9519/gm1.9519_g
MVRTGTRLRDWGLLLVTTKDLEAHTASVYYQRLHPSHMKKEEMHKFDEALPHEHEGIFQGDGTATANHDPEQSIPDTESLTPEAYDKYLQAEVMIPIGDERVCRVVKRRYIKKAIQEVERDSAKANLWLPTKTATPMASGYQPELDQSPELDAA